MSIKVMTMVWDHAPLKGNDLLILLALADFADDPPAADKIFPAADTLARKVRSSRATVHRTLSKLKDMGLLEVISEKPGRPVHYRIAVQLLTEETGVSNCDTSDHPGVSHSEAKVSQFETKGSQSETGVSRSERGGVSQVRQNPSTKPSSNLGAPAASDGPPPDGRPIVASRHLEHADSIGRLMAAVHDHEWRGILGRLHVVKATELAVKISYRSQTEVEFVEVNHRQAIADAFQVPTSAVQIVKGGRPPAESEAKTA